MYNPPHIYDSKRKKKKREFCEIKSCLHAINMTLQFDESSTEEKELTKCSPDKKKAYRSGKGGEEPAMWTRIWVTARREREHEGPRSWLGWKRKRKKIIPQEEHTHDASSTPIHAFTMLLRGTRILTKTERQARHKRTRDTHLTHLILYDTAALVFHRRKRESENNK